MSDLQVIKQLEQKLGVKLKHNIDHRVLRSYVLNEHDHVIELGLYGCGITDMQIIIDLLLQLRSLQVLNLSNNQLTDVSPLNDLTSLKELNLAHNQLTDVSPLSCLTSLQKLHLAVNQLTDVSPLSGLT